MNNVYNNKNILFKFKLTLIKKQKGR